MLMELTATDTAISDVVATKVEVELISDPAAELVASVKVAANGNCREEASSASSSDEFSTVNCINQAWQGVQNGLQFCQGY